AGELRGGARRVAKPGSRRSQRFGGQARAARDLRAGRWDRSAWTKWRLSLDQARRARNGDYQAAGRGGSAVAALVPAKRLGEVGPGDPGRLACWQTRLPEGRSPRCKAKRDAPRPLRNRTTPRFWQFYRDLPGEVRRLADKNVELLKRDPRHPSLQLKKV